jgi:hypothetical protein
MTTTVGASTSYQLTVPALSETADIQVALKLLAYGQSADPTNNADIEANSLIGYLLTGLSTKSKIDSPTFTGTVTLPTQSNSSAPLRFVSGTLKNLTQTGAMEFDGTRLYLTSNSSTRKTIAYLDDAGYTLLYSGSINYSNSSGSGVLTSGRDFSNYQKIKILFIAGANGGTGTFTLKFNSQTTGYAYTYNNYGSTTLSSTSSGGAYNIGNGSSIGVGKSIIVTVEDPGANMIPKHVSWQNSVGWGYGTNNSLSDSITSISWTATTTTPGADWYIYGIK